MNQERGTKVNRIGADVKYIRERLGSVYAFARLCGVTPRMAFYWLRGERTSRKMDDHYQAL